MWAAAAPGMIVGVVPEGIPESEHLYYENNLYILRIFIHVQHEPVTDPYGWHHSGRFGRNTFLKSLQLIIL